MELTDEQLAAQERALLDDVGAVALARDVLRVHGPDAVDFLQGQLSQEVAGLAVGGSAWSLLLQPQGRVDALVRVTRLGPDDLVLDVDGGWGDAVVTRLQRFKLRTKATLTPLPWRCLAIRGPRAVDVVGGVASTMELRDGDGAPVATGVLVLPADWPGLPGVDLLGPEPQLPDGVPLSDVAAYEAVRVAAGVPVMGAELTDRTIPAEAGLVDRTVSFVKGCYTGQELVARLDARGSNVARRLCAVVVPGDAVPPPGATLVDAGGAEVGELTSVARSAARGETVALAYVRRQVASPAELLVRWDAGSATALVDRLPAERPVAPGP